MLDIIIRNGFNARKEPVSIGIRDGKIVKTHITPSDSAVEEIDLQQRHYVSAGWIDSHVHCDSTSPIYYDDPDEVGVKKGVATVIDAGSTGADNIESFYQRTRTGRTNVYALANISITGIMTQDELADTRNIRKDRLKETAAAFSDFIVGIKARMSKSVVVDNDYHPLVLAKEIQSELDDMTLMVHFGSHPPELKNILSRMDNRDILTHCFNGKDNGILDGQSSVIKTIAAEAYERGVRFDLGHGSDSFSFRTARYAQEAGITPQTISTDIYHRNRVSGPVYDLATTMEKMLAIGYSLPEIIPMVTEHAADNFRLSTKGRLAEGYDADVTIFDVETGNKKLVDSDGISDVGSQVIVPRHVIVGGKIYDI